MKKLSFPTIFPYRKESAGFLSRLEFYPLLLISMAVIGFILIAYDDNPWPKQGLIAYAVLAVLCTISAGISHHVVIDRIAANQSSPSPFVTSLAFIAILLFVTVFAWPIIVTGIALLLTVWIDMIDAKKSGRKKREKSEAGNNNEDDSNGKDHC